MNTEKLIETLRDIKIVPVISLENSEDSSPLGKTLIKSGIPVAEITFRSAAAIESIQRLRDDCPDILIGAGTVLDAKQAKSAKQAGADFIVSPGFNPNTVKACQDLGITIIPGVNNPTTIEAALELDITTVKFFPAEASGGIAMLKALLAPYAMLKVMPTGGINKENLCDYLAIKNVIACGGSWMVDKTLIEQKDWDKISQLCLQVREIIA